MAAGANSHGRSAIAKHSRIHFCRQAAREHPYPPCPSLLLSLHLLCGLTPRISVAAATRRLRPVSLPARYNNAWFSCPSVMPGSSLQRANKTAEKQRRERGGEERERMMRIHSGWVYVWALTSKLGRVNEGARGGIGDCSRRRSAKRGAKVPGAYISARNVEYKAEVTLSSDFNPPRLAAIFRQRNCSFVERFPYFTCHVGIFTSTTISC